MPVINGDYRDDYLNGGNDKDTINGLDGDDQLYGLSGNDVLNGGADNDFLDGGSGKDQLNGKSGDDQLTGGLGDTLDGGDGVDRGSINLSSTGADIIAALDFSAGAVNDLGGKARFSNLEYLQLSTGSGDDMLSFGASSMRFGNPDHSWNAGDGRDRVIVDWSSTNLGVYATASSIQLAELAIQFSNVEEYEWNTGSGTDTLYGGVGNDTLRTNGGNDYLEGDEGNDVLDGGAGQDEIRAGVAEDDSGEDAVDAGDGDDVVYAGYRDTANGGAGVDLLVLDISDREANLAMNFTPAAGVVANGTTFSNFERMHLSTGSGNDVITVNSSVIISVSSGQEQLWNGGGGKDRLVADFSDIGASIYSYSSAVNIGDFVFGLSQVESFEITGGWGSDSMYGGDAADTYRGMGGDDYLEAYKGNDLLDGGGGRDTLKGVDGNDRLLGGDDRDSMEGGTGKDTLEAGGGRDRLFGGEGEDRLEGGDGGDFMTGGFGRDLLIGGDGPDTYRYADALESTSRDFDTVQGFDFAGADQFYFSSFVNGLDATVISGRLDNSSSFSNQLEAAIGAGQLAVDNAVLFTPTAGDYAGSLFLIVDQNNLAGYQDEEDFVIRLTDALNLAAADLTDFQGSSSF